MNIYLEKVKSLSKNDNLFYDYQSLIINKNRTKGDKHHIFPRSFGVDNNPENIVILSPLDHYDAHQLLSRMFDGKHHEKMAKALWRMSNSSTRIITTPEEYDEARDIFVKSQIGRSAEERFGNEKGAELRRKISEKQRVRYNNMSLDDYKLLSEKIRGALSNRTVDEKQVQISKMLETRENWSDEKKEAVREKIRQNTIRQFQNMPEQKRNEIAKKRSVSLKKTNANKTDEERRMESENKKARFARMTDEEKRQWAAKIKETKAQQTKEKKEEISKKLVDAHAKHSTEKKIEIAEKIRIAHTSITEEEKTKRSQRTTEALQKVWKNRTPEERAIILAKKSASMKEYYKRKNGNTSTLQETYVPRRRYA